MSEPRNLRKTRTGVVVSDKMDKTVVVAIVDKSKHPLYKKTITKTKKVKAHDEANDCVVGDKVRIVETRKLSKDKNWRVAEIGLVELLFAGLVKAQLQSGVAVFFHRLDLHHGAGARFHYRDGDDLAVRSKDLRHADFAADDCFIHR